MAKETKKETAVVKQELKLIPMNQSSAARGFDAFDSEDLIVPYAKLMQALSPEVKDREKPEIKDGDIINSLTSFNYGTEILFIPLSFQKRRILWITRDNGGGMACQSFNGKNPNTTKYSDKCAFCPMKDWGSNEMKEKSIKELGFDEKDISKPLCAMYYTFPSIVLNMESKENQLIAITLGKTSFKSGKQFINLARSRGGDIFSHAYKLKSVQEKNEKGDFNILSVYPSGEELNEKELAELETIYDFVVSSDINIHMEDENAAQVKGEPKKEQENNSSDDIPF